MKIDPMDSSLYTDAGLFLKVLSCPHGKSWDVMRPRGEGTRICDTCSRSVHDTAVFDDHDLLVLLKRDPAACLMVSPQQGNCTVIPRALQGSRQKARLT